MWSSFFIYVNETPFICLLFEIYVCSCFSLGNLCYSLCTNLSVHQVWTFETDYSARMFLCLKYTQTFLWTCYAFFIGAVTTVCQSPHSASQNIQLMYNIHCRKNFNYSTLRKNRNSSGAPYNKNNTLHYIVHILCELKHSSHYIVHTSWTKTHVTLYCAYTSWVKTYVTLYCAYFVS
jgi:hypothetical protein